jgi:hypothetical protein
VDIFDGDIQKDIRKDLRRLDSGKRSLIWLKWIGKILWDWWAAFFFIIMLIIAIVNFNS